MGPILALDLATRTGFAFGPPGSTPESGSVLLKKKGEVQDVAFGNMLDWLNGKLQFVKPSLVVIEQRFMLGANARQGSQANADLSYGLHGVVRGMCRCYKIRLEAAHPATVNKHFIGIGRGKRPELKAATLVRARMLGYVPILCEDDNRADAVAIFDWAAATYGRARPAKLVLFGEVA